MRNRSKLLLACLAATILMAFAVGAASAKRIQTSSQPFLLKWDSTSQQLAFSDNAGHHVSCEVTLDGSFHSRTISKVCGQLIGYISRAIVLEECNGSGHARALTETLPWHIQYNSFSGTLPLITGITLTLVNATFNVETNEGLHCKSHTTQREPGFGRANINSSGVVTGIEALAEHTISLGGEGFLCELASPGHFSGRGHVDEGETTTNAITIRLVQ